MLLVGRLRLVFDAFMTGRESVHDGMDIGFFLVPSFSLFSYAAALEPIRTANDVLGRKFYRWFVITHDGEPVQSSNGLTAVADQSIDGERVADMLIVCAGIEVEAFHDPRSFAWLRRQARRGIPIGGICTGSLVLARAGLLEGYRSTIYWENLANFREEFPNLDITSALYEVDRGRFTCGGGVSCLDLVHHLIAQHHGADAASAVSERFTHTRVRDGHDPQRMALRERLGIHHAKLLSVLEEMEEHIEEPLSREQLARTAGLSIRQLERLFRTYLGHTLGQHYLDLRLQRARLLLKQSSRSVLDIALACGFVSASHFSRAYRMRYGHPPTAERPGLSGAARAHPAPLAAEHQGDIVSLLGKRP